MAMAMAHVWSHDDLCIWESSNLLPLEISEPQVFNVNLSVMFLQESSALQGWQNPDPGPGPAFPVPDPDPDDNFTIPGPDITRIF
ncbi:hypothetical protein WN944_000683 [Citrus x changshan-huyou]|uniref:Uncharacterized protein n=1 Tax=Citrus x changshan-huyou TaxID=2935761 RepID=A0AAP0QM45_9ROSI